MLFITFALYEVCLCRSAGVKCRQRTIGDGLAQEEYLNKISSKLSSCGRLHLPLLFTCFLACVPSSLSPT